MSVLSIFFPTPPLPPHQSEYKLARGTRSEKLPPGRQAAVISQGFYISVSPTAAEASPVFWGYWILKIADRLVSAIYFS